MKKVSQAYKEAMNKDIREQGFISIVLAEVNGIAQQEARFLTEGAYWSNSETPFDASTQIVNYATFENGYTRADGKSLVMPREGGNIQNTGFTTTNVMQPITIGFGAAYDIKGLTIDFGVGYPTEFKVATNLNPTGTTYTNDNPTFTTQDTLGEISSITITPISMVNGNKRLRINHILMGVGLSYSNDDVESAELTEENSPISAELPSTEFSVTILDEDNKYNINNSDSFINFLTGGQTVTVAFGVTLEDESIEWLKTQTLYLKEWAAKEGKFTFSANDTFCDLNNTYTLGNRVYTRTAYAEAESILQDAGLLPGDYEIDNYLRDITLVNPMPEDTHANCLKLLCNATRCIQIQDKDGIIKIKGYFALSIQPDNLEITSNSATPYSTLRNLLYTDAVTTHYADFSANYSLADGEMSVLPSNSAQYDGNTGYISSVLADENGDFTTNPTITVELEAGFTYYSLFLNFSGQVPEEVIVHTFYNNSAVDNYTFTNLQKENILTDEFTTFNKMVLEFTKTAPYSRVVVDYLGLGNLTDYYLNKGDMMSRLIGSIETKIADVSVKIYSFTQSGSDEPQEVEDDVWYKHTINNEGRHIEVTNQLIHTAAQAQAVAEWIGLYYDNNRTYECDYRGDPRLNAMDIIKVEDDYLNNLQVEITKATLTFNGGFKGKLEMRKAVNEQ